jgi:hypothetical protein
MPDQASEGQSIYDSPLGSARIQNRVVEGSEDYAQRKRLGEGAAHYRSVRDPDVIKIRADVNLPRGSVLGIGAPSITPLDHEHQWFEYAAQHPETPFAITLRQAQQSRLVECLVAGVCLARVNVSDTGHRFARVENSQSDLKSAGAGPVKLLKAPTATGVQELPVHLHYEPRIEAVQVTSLVKTGDYYPGTLLRVDPDGTITSMGSVWILDLNDDS